MIKNLFKLIKFLCLSFILSILLLGSVERKFEGMIYVSKDTLTMSWDSVEKADRYEIRAVDVLHDPQTIKDLGQTIETHITLNRLTSSLWEYQVRACNDAGCSDWAKSGDKTYATVNGYAEAWRVYWKTPKPTGGGVY